MKEDRPWLFGEVLVDEFPGKSAVPGGAAFNVAWHLQALGAAPLLVSRLGDDAAGRQLRGLMSRHGLSQRGLQMDSEHPTGRVSVTYKAGEPVFEILPDQAYDFIAPDELPDHSAFSLLYHGTLALRNPVSNAALELLKTRDAPVFLDVNLRDPWWERERVLALLADARWAKLNEDELVSLVGEYDDLGRVVEECRRHWDLELLVVTLGAHGALAASPTTYTRVVPDDIWALDPVGAGDAFASVLILGISQGWTLDICLSRAQVLAGEVVQRRGATIQEPQVYEKLRREWKLD